MEVLEPADPDPDTPSDTAQNRFSEPIGDTGPFESRQSDFKATPEQHRATDRGRGKPRKDGTQAGKVVPGVPGGINPPRLTPIPRPSVINYKSDATNPNQRTKALWTYWNSLPEWARDRIVAYVYRDWPCLVPVDEESGEYVYIDKISGSEPIQDDTDLLKKYGCGSYRVLINEQPGGTLAMGYLYNIGGNDLKSNPPTDRRVSDISQVDLGRKENNSYKEFLRMRGLLPEQTNLIREKSEMAQVEAVREAVGGVERMANKLVEMADRKSGEGNITNEMIRDSVATANDITKQAVTYALKVKDEAHEKDGATAGATGTTEMFNLMMTMMERMVEIRGNGGSVTDPGLMAELSALRAQVDKMRDQQIESLRTELVALRANPQSAQSTSSLFDQIKALKELKGVIDEIGLGSGKESGEGAVADAVVTAVKDDMPPWMSKYVLPLAAQIIPALLNRGQPPAPIPQQPQPVSIHQQNNPQPQLPAPVPVPAQPQSPSPTMSAAPIVSIDPLDNMLNYVAMPLLNYLADNDTTGSNFGEWLASGFGDEVLEEAQKMSPEVWTAAIRKHPITGPGLVEINPPMLDGRLEKFVGDFLGYKPNYADEPAPAPTPTA